MPGFDGNSGLKPDPHSCTASILPMKSSSQPLLVLCVCVCTQDGIEPTALNMLGKGSIAQLHCQYFVLCMMHVCECGHAHPMVQVWKSKDNLEAEVISLLPSLVLIELTFSGMARASICWAILRILCFLLRLGLKKLTSLVSNLWSCLSFSGSQDYRPGGLALLFCPLVIWGIFICLYYFEPGSCFSPGSLGTYDPSASYVLQFQVWATILRSCLFFHLWFLLFLYLLFWDRITDSPGCPWTYFGAKEDLELLILLPQIIGIYHNWFLWWWISKPKLYIC